MNCKPGDLVRAIDHPVSRRFGFVDLIFKVEVLDRNRVGEPAWEYNGPPRYVSGMRIEVIADKLLRPIHNPGEDAQDETLAWKPVPMKDEVPA